MFLRRSSQLVLLLALAVLSLGWIRPTETLMLEMEDGTQLATDYYLPEGGTPPFPVILVRSSYPKAMIAHEGSSMLNKGYACVVQDVRGTGFSKGKKDIWFADGWREGFQDGKWTLDWVKRQPWCNGKVCTYGPSALGITQVLMAPTTPDLTCQSIEVAASSFYHNLAYPGGVWRKNLCDGWLTGLGLIGAMEIYKSHPHYDDFWTFYDAEAKAPEVDVPAIHTGGWYDIFQQGTINSFVTRQNSGGPRAKGNQILVMSWRSHTSRYGKDYHVPDDRKRAINKNQLRQDFLDYWLKGVGNGIMDGPAVYYFTLGDDKDPNAPGMEWRTAKTWPPFEADETPFYLCAGGLLSTSPAGESGQAPFTYDPNNPFPTCGGNNLFLPAGPHDQRRVNQDRTDYLRFATEPLTEPVEATGRIKVKLCVSTDAPDTDFTAKLVDIFPAGDEREILVLDGIQRVKLRNGFDKFMPLLTSSEEVVELEVDLWSTSWVFNTGHRIGLQISSSNYPRFEKNPNTGDDFPDGVTPRVAHNVVHFGGNHTSALILPLKPKSAS